MNRRLWLTLALLLSRQVFALADDSTSRLPAEALQIQTTIETLNSAPFRPQEAHKATLDRNANLDSDRARREQLVRDALGGGGSIDQSSVGDQPAAEKSPPKSATESNSD